MGSNKPVARFLAGAGTFLFAVALALPAKAQDADAGAPTPSPAEDAGAPPIDADASVPQAPPPPPAVTPPPPPPPPAEGNGDPRQAASASQIAPKAPTANGPEPAHGFRGPLAPVGDWLGDKGFFPIMFAGEWFVTNPDMGVKHSHQWMTQFNAGFDYYLEPLTGLKGTSIHFLEGMVPWITDQTATNNYFTQAGDVVNASASGYVPVTAHLTRLTLEQQLFDNKLFVEGGKGYVNDYVARPLCMNAFMCMSTIAITHKATGFNFPNYSNWIARIGSQITPKLTVQAIYYKYDNNASQTDGWELSRDSNYNAGLVDIQYSDPKAEMPRSAELMAYYNGIPQTSQSCATCPKKTTHWQGGFLASAMQTVWRPDVHKPTMLQVFGEFGNTLNPKQTTSPSVGGIDYALDAGVTIRSPFPWWSLDSYSLQVTAVQLSYREQEYLLHQGYGNDRTEFMIGGSALFRPLNVLFISPYVEYLADANAAFAANAFVNPTHSSPTDGFAFGLTLAVPLNELLGLTTRRSGYDGHYP